MAVIEVTVRDGETVEDPDRETLFDLLSELNLTHRLLVVRRLDMPGPGEWSMRVLLQDDMSCSVAYREGPNGPNACDVGAPFDFYGHEVVADVVEDWVRGGDQWRTALDWRPSGGGA